MNAGEMRWLVEIQTPPDTLSSFGEASGSWTYVGQDRAKVTPTSGSNTEAGLPQRESTNWYEVATRRNGDLIAGRRIVVSGSPYEGKTLYVSDSQHTLTSTTARCFERLAG